MKKNRKIMLLVQTLLIGGLLFSSVSASACGWRWHHGWHHRYWHHGWGYRRWGYRRWGYRRWGYRRWGWRRWGYRRWGWRRWGYGPYWGGPAIVYRGPGVRVRVW